MLGKLLRFLFLIPGHIAVLIIEILWWNARPLGIFSRTHQLTGMQVYSPYGKGGAFIAWPVAVVCWFLVIVFGISILIAGSFEAGFENVFNFLDGPAE